MSAEPQTDTSAVIEHSARSSDSGEQGGAFAPWPPRKPEPTDPRARWFLEWTDVIVYAVWRAASVIALVLALTSALLIYGPGILR